MCVAATSERLGGSITRLLTDSLNFLLLSVVNSTWSDRVDRASINVRRYNFRESLSAPLDC